MIEFKILNTIFLFLNFEPPECVRALVALQNYHGQERQGSGGDNFPSEVNHLHSGTPFRRKSKLLCETLYFNSVLPPFLNKCSQPLPTYLTFMAKVDIFKIFI